MKIGDIVVRKSYGGDVVFKIVDIEEKNGVKNYILKGMEIRILADSREEDLDILDDNKINERNFIITKKINNNIKKILANRGGAHSKGYRKSSDEEKFDISFGRPGKILHVDADPEYLQTCLKVYKRLMLNVAGVVIKESEQPKVILDIVKQNRPDIILLTGHDGINKGARDYTDVESYRNSKYFIESVSILRNYESNYDDLVIFAGACQSFYEGILDAGANFASSPGRVLIHCLDPVFLCEKIAYTNIEKVVSLKDGIENTITGIKGIGGLQTRGKYREGYPKSEFL